MSLKKVEDASFKSISFECNFERLKPTTNINYANLVNQELCSELAEVQFDCLLKVCSFQTLHRDTTHPV